MDRGSEVRVIPINQLFAEVLRDGGLLEGVFTDVDDFSWDAAPHGYWWFYLYSNLITTMVMTEQPIPTDYELPELPSGDRFATAVEIESAGGVAEIPTELRTQFRPLVDYWWERLNNTDLSPRVFSRPGEGARPRRRNEYRESC